MDILDIGAALKKSVAANQGAENFGKILAVGEDGKVVPVNGSGAEVITADDVLYSGATTYDDGTVGKTLKETAADVSQLKSEITQLDDDTTNLTAQLNNVKTNLQVYVEPGTQIVKSTQYGYATLSSGVWAIRNTTSTSWVQYTYAVSKNVEYTIKADLTYQADNVAAVYFAPQINVNQVVDCLAESQTAAFNTCYTPNADGYIIVLESVNTVVRASSISVAPAKYTDFQTEIVALEESLTYEAILPYTAQSGVVSSVDGEILSSSASVYITIDLTENSYRTLTFKVTPYSADRGYGFVLSDNSWVGVKTTSNTTVTVNVPKNAISFKTCWSTSYVSATGQIIKASINGSIQDVIDMMRSLPARHNYPIDLSKDLSVVSAPIMVSATYDVQTDIYDRYDTFVSDYPDWCEKIDCSDAAAELELTPPAYLNDLPIYLYKFSPTRTNVTDHATRLSVMILTGVHANELLDFFTVYHFFKYINENWKTDNTAAQLRTMVDFYVMPCVSPWSYENKSRVNGNGVNINRNFPTSNWSVSGYGTEDYTGASAGSEYETQLVMYYANLFKPDVFWDAHTGGMTATGRYGCINVDAGAKQYVINMAMAFGMNLVKEWVANNTDFPQYIDDSPLFTVGLGSTVGATYIWASENITDVSFLTEESIINNWVEGVLYQETQESNTQRIWNENMKSVYGAILWSLSVAKEQTN